MFFFDKLIPLSLAWSSACSNWFILHRLTKLQYILSNFFSLRIWVFYIYKLIKKKSFVPFKITLRADYHVNRRLSKKPLLKPKMLIVDLFVTAKEKISVATTRYEMWQKSQDLSHCDFFFFSGENEWIVAALFKVSLPYHFYRSFTMSHCLIL